MLKAERVSEILDDVEKELMTACEKHGETFANEHHGYAVLLEELEEAWDEVKKDNTAKAIAEMKQVAAMAIKFILNFEKK